MPTWAHPSRGAIPCQLKAEWRKAGWLGCVVRSDFGITMLVRVYPPGVSGRSQALRACVGLFLFSVTGCGLFSGRDGAHIGYYLPLTVQLRQAPTVAAAQLTYQDACGQNQVLPFGQQLAEAITRKSGRVFEKIVTG